MEHKNAISLRFATIFGASPKMRVDLMVNDFAYKAVNDRSVVLFASRSKRTFIHLDDAIDSYIFALNNNDKMAGQVYNVGDQEMNFSKLEIAEAIAKHVDFEIIDSTLPDLDTRNFYVSFKKINALGYKAEKSLEEGISELLKLYTFYKIYSPYNLI